MISLVKSYFILSSLCTAVVRLLLKIVILINCFTTSGQSAANNKVMRWATINLREFKRIKFGKIMKVDLLVRLADDSNLKHALKYAHIARRPLSKKR